MLAGARSVTLNFIVADVVVVVLSLIPKSVFSVAQVIVVAPLAPV